MSATKMNMPELGEWHARVHVDLGLGYQPAAPNDAWFAAEQPGCCLAGMYASYLRAYRNACKNLGIALGNVVDRSFSRFNVTPVTQ